MEQESKFPEKLPLDLLIVIIFSIIGVAMVLALPDGNFLRVIFGIPLLIFFPGYALVSLLWPRISLENIERIALSFGLSIVLVAIVGLAMHYLVDLSLSSISAGLLLIIILISSLAFYQRSKIPEDDVFVFHISNIIPVLPKSKPEKSMVLFLAVCLIVSSIALGYIATRPATGETYTELYVLDINGTTENYPVNLSVNEIGQVIVGVVCHESDSTDYEILFGRAGVGDSGLVSNWEEPQIMNSPLLTRRNVTLEHDGIFEDICEFSFTTPGIYQIVWELEINGQATNYDVHLWVEVHY